MACLWGKGLRGGLPERRQTWNGTWFVATAIAGGMWGGLLARVLAEWWPLQYLCSQGMCCWVWSPWCMAALGLLGALATPVILHALFPLSDGRKVFARSWPLALAAGYLCQPVVEPVWGLGALGAGLAGTVWLSRRESARRGWMADWLWDVAAFAVPLVVYIAMLAPSVLPGDSGEFQFAAPTLSIPHPTGYPLYLLLGKLFSALPIGSTAYRVNLLSAVAAAGAVWAIYRAGRALNQRRAASLVGASLLMVSESFWSQATIAEKYALNATFVALTLYLILRWRRARLAGRASAGWLYAWALCYGLSLTHHRTMALLAPAYAWLLWSTDRTVLRPRRALRWVLLALAPLTLYLLLPLFSSFDPPYAYIRVDSIAAFGDLVLARTYQSGLFRGGWATLSGRLSEFGGLLIRQFGLWGLLLALAGWVSLLRRARNVAWALLGGMAAQVLFALNYHVPNTPVYYLPVYVWLAVCVGAAAERILGAVLGSSGQQRRDAGAETMREGTGWQAGLPPSALPHLGLICVLALAALPVSLGASRWIGMDQRRSYDNLAFDHTYGQMALCSVEANAVIVSDWLPATVLWYVQFVDGLAPTAQIAAADSLEWQWLGIVEGALAAARPVYLARPLMAAGDRYALSSAGPLVQVRSEPQFSVPSMSHSLGIDLGSEMRLLGYDGVVTGPGSGGAARSLSSASVPGGSTLHLTLYWQALHVPDGDYAVVARLVDADGRTRVYRQNRHPVGGTYPTSRWRPGEIVADSYSLALPPHLPSGEYRAQVSIGVAFAESGLQDQAGNDRVSLEPFVVRKPRQWAHPQPGVEVRRMMGGDLVLMGYDAPGAVVPGETVALAVQWLACGSGGDRPQPRLVLVGQDGAESVLTPLPGSPEDWVAGALVVQEYAFVVPMNLERIEARTDRSSVWNPSRHRLRVAVSSAPPAVADFGNLIRLRSAAYATEALHAGDTMRLTLEWEAVRAVNEPYKVFVHVLGRNGLPIAQQDNEPVQGTYPTTRWQSGERVSDPYAISLPSDLAPGEYAVEVGLYRISDLSRLPVLDDGGSVVDDKVFLPPLVIE